MKPGAGRPTPVATPAVLCLVTYRVIYQLADDDQTVRVADIRHRSMAYRTDPR